MLPNSDKVAWNDGHRASPLAVLIQLLQVPWVLGLLRGFRALGGSIGRFRGLGL